MRFRFVVKKSQEALRAHDAQYGTQYSNRRKHWHKNFEFDGYGTVAKKLRRAALRMLESGNVLGVRVRLQVDYLEADWDYKRRMRKKAYDARRRQSKKK